MGIGKSWPLILCLNCRSGSRMGPESRSVLQTQTHQWWAGSVLALVGWKHLRCCRKVYLQQTNIIQRTLSQVVRETTALKKQGLCHSVINICTDWFWLQTNKFIHPVSPAFGCNEQDRVMIQYTQASQEKLMTWNTFAWRKFWYQILKRNIQKEIQ